MPVIGFELRQDSWAGFLTRPTLRAYCLRPRLLSAGPGCCRFIQRDGLIGYPEVSACCFPELLGQQFLVTPTYRVCLAH